MFNFGSFGNGASGAGGFGNKIGGIFGNMKNKWGQMDNEQKSSFLNNLLSSNKDEEQTQQQQQFVPLQNSNVDFSGFVQPITQRRYY